MNCIWVKNKEKLGVERKDQEILLNETRQENASSRDHLLASDSVDPIRSRNAELVHSQLVGLESQRSTLAPPDFHAIATALDQEMNRAAPKKHGGRSGGISEEAFKLGKADLHRQRNNYKRLANQSTATVVSPPLNPEVFHQLRTFSPPNLSKEVANQRLQDEILRNSRHVVYESPDDFIQVALNHRLATEAAGGNAPANASGMTPAIYLNTAADEAERRSNRIRNEIKQDQDDVTPSSQKQCGPGESQKRLGLIKKIYFGLKLNHPNAESAPPRVRKRLQKQQPDPTVPKLERSRASREAGQRSQTCSRAGRQRHGR